MTGTALARLRKQALCAKATAARGEGHPVKGAAGRCGVAGTTPVRWRHRLLAAIKAGSIKLEGIVEAGET